MIIGVPKEIKLQEHRIGLTPNSVKTLCDKGHKVLVESNGGFEAGFTNEDYLKAGAKVLKTPVEIGNDEFEIDQVETDRTYISIGEEAYELTVSVNIKKKNIILEKGAEKIR